jgi:hypothetical protein
VGFLFTSQFFDNLNDETVWLYDLVAFTRSRFVQVEAHFSLVFEQLFAPLAWEDAMMSVQVCSATVSKIGNKNRIQEHTSLVLLSLEVSGHKISSHGHNTFVDYAFDTGRRI